MSAWYEDIDAVRHSLVCPFCAARPGERCVTVSGKPARYIHGARAGIIDNAFAIGYDEGQKDAYYSLAARHGYAVEQVQKYRTKLLGGAA